VVFLKNLSNNVKIMDKIFSHDVFFNMHELAIKIILDKNYFCDVKLNFIKLLLHKDKLRYLEIKFGSN
jgi:hypothetical protein